MNASISVALAGSGGAGVMTAGNMLLEAAALAGYYGLMTRTSGPQIRGGEAAAMLRLSTFPTDGQDDRFQILAAIDWQNVGRFAAELPLGAQSLLVGDPAHGEPPEIFLKSGARFLPVPFKEMTKKIAGAWPNMVALGVLAGLCGLSLHAVEAAARKSMKKGLEPGIEAARAGMALADSFSRDYFLNKAPKATSRWLMTGNEAAGYGAVRGGVRFVAAYPITPATELLEWLAPALTKVGGTLVQAEDELASINMILGASYGGVPALTATSGPGLSLMIESLGLGVTAELPVVVVDVMRTGPSTGIATKSEQADLNIALYGMHGDAPHIVIAPNSVSDCLDATQWAVGLAEQLQVPAIVLSDQYFGQARAVVDKPALNGEKGVRTLFAEKGPDPFSYKRYALTPSGISPMAIPGTPGCTYTADGLEHNEKGTPSSQAADHLAQMDKRARKISQLDPGDAWASIEGEGDVALLTFGSCTGPAREAFARARAEGFDARLISLRMLAPAQPERLRHALEGVKQAIVLEQNHSGQFLRYLRAEYDIPCKLTSLRRPGPLPFRPDEIYQNLLRMRNP